MTNDPMRGIADAVADFLSQRGYAFVEDEQLEALANALRSFLKTSGIPVNGILGEPETKSTTPWSL